MRQYTATEMQEKMITYSTLCLNSCSKESEEATLIVSKVIDVLVQDAARISKMSTETLEALNNIKTVINKKREEHHGNESELSELVLALKKLSHEDTDINGIVMPVIEALQFQDRIQQQLNNLKKNMKVWQIFRDNVPANEEDLEKYLITFGESMLKNATTDQEHQIVRQIIKGIPEVKNVQSDDPFFF